MGTILVPLNFIFIVIKSLKSILFPKHFRHTLPYYSYMSRYYIFLFNHLHSRSKSECQRSKVTLLIAELWKSGRLRKIEVFQRRNWNQLRLLFNLQNCNVHSFIHSFIRSFIHSFTHSFVHSFTHSYTHSFIHSLIHSYILPLIHSHI